MRNLLDEDVDRFRLRTPQILERFGSYGDEGCGMFVLPSPAQSWVRVSVIAATGMGWDHVSVSTRNRAPFWEEMDAIKRLFFRPEEEAFQLHVAEADHVNVHPYCLHLWRPHFEVMPLPPKAMVG